MEIDNIDDDDDTNNNSMKLTKLFIKQIYKNVTSSHNNLITPNKNMKKNDYYLLFNNKRLDSIYIQGVITRIFPYHDPLTGKHEVRFQIDDGSAHMYITNAESFLNADMDNFKKGYYILAHGLLSLEPDRHLAFLHPITMKVVTDPNIEILWALEIINCQKT